jgi:hypothetical protein
MTKSSTLMRKAKGQIKMTKMTKMATRVLRRRGVRKGV